jgi:NAD(P)-dependent dehydrogenase (short-subunit alcohol dehydrogenase family)
VSVTQTFFLSIFLFASLRLCVSSIHYERGEVVIRLKPIDQQVVVVFGASSGIGRETALRFAKRGAKVVVAARSEEGLQSLVDEIRSGGGEATAIPADVVEFEQIKAVADGAVEKYGRLDTWVHLAAVSLYATFEQTAPEEFKRVIETNLVGQAYGAMAALPHLRRTGQGALIHVSSVEGKRALPLQSAYASSKHGVIGFLDALRLELQHEGVPISVTNVMPAGILYAAEHPTRDIEAGGAAKMLILNQRLSPRMMDAILVRTGFKGQQTEEPKSDDAPHNLYHPIGGYNRVQGDFSEQAKKSAASWLDTHPAARKVVKGAALAAVAVVAARAIGNRR